MYLEIKDIGNLVIDRNRNRIFYELDPISLKDNIRRNRSSLKMSITSMKEICSEIEEEQTRNAVSMYIDFLTKVYNANRNFDPELFCKTHDEDTARKGIVSELSFDVVPFFVQSIYLIRKKSRSINDRDKITKIFSIGKQCFSTLGIFTLGGKEMTEIINNPDSLKAVSFDIAATINSEDRKQDIVLDGIPFYIRFGKKYKKSFVHINDFNWYYNKEKYTELRKTNVGGI